MGLGGGGGALAAFIGLSLASLFADVAYEGARSVSGPFLESLGAAALAVGVLGVGDLVSHAFRVLGGVAAHALAGPRAAWALVFLGYTVNLVAVPLLALAGRWLEALALYIVERAGKGLRAVPRDAILAAVASEVAGGRRGLAFSLHELADQAGAVAGGVVVAAAIASSGSYAAAFTALAAPAAAALAALAVAYAAYPRPRIAPGRAPRGPGAPAWAAPLSAAAGLGTAALMHWGLASYTLTARGTPPEEVALLYALAMAADGAAAVPLGLLYDRAPAAALALAPPLSAAATTLLILGGSPAVAAIAWGAAMAAYETAYRASAARAPPESRAAVYTLLYASTGAGWAAGSLAMAALLNTPQAVAALAWALAAAGAAAAARAESPRGESLSPARP